MRLTAERQTRRTRQTPSFFKKLGVYVAAPRQIPSFFKKLGVYVAAPRYTCWLLAALLVYLLLACSQLGLPGLHYDEAKEAGLNAMQMLTGAPVTPFRDAAWTLGNLRLPLMVQDYIGALNVYLALPLLGLSGIGVPNLRLLPVIEGLIALILLERAVSEWWAWRAGGLRHVDDVTYDDSPAHPLTRSPAPLSFAGLCAVTLLAASPSYVFWARQGVFVTNLLLPCALLCLWQGVRWLRTGRPGALVLAGLGAGLALYAKLSAWWVVVPFALLAGGWWIVKAFRQTGMRSAEGESRRDGETIAADLMPLRLSTLVAAAAAMLLPLLPLLAFNLLTGGTFASIFGNLQRSYYGVDNADLAANALVRWGQLVQVLRGDQFWYLGAVYANGAAPALALLAVAAGLWRNWRVMAGPLLLLGGVFLASLFTVSDLFVTHYVLVQPLLAAVVGLGLGVWVDATPPVETGGYRDAKPTKVGWPAEIAPDEQPVSTGFAWASRRFQPAAWWTRALAALFLLLWLLLDLTASLRYHAALAQSGGLADHSDASYHLAYHLQTNGMGAPIALDWGMDATVRYLTRGAVTPVEIFGYASPAAPDADFAARLAVFLANPDNRYLLHAPEATVFAGRREAFLAAVGASGKQATREAVFAQRDGAPLYEIWRVTEP